MSRFLARLARRGQPADVRSSTFRGVNWHGVLVPSSERAFWLRSLLEVVLRGIKVMVSQSDTNIVNPHSNIKLVVSHTTMSGATITPPCSFDMFFGFLNCPSRVPEPISPVQDVQRVHTASSPGLFFQSVWRSCFLRNEGANLVDHLE